jgi:NAD(P)-dependent dehydrogenase (short-subunit alcohol dehydrogenase family)
MTAAVELAGTASLVTGGGRGIGRLLARSSRRRGATVGLIARSEDELAETVWQVTAITVIRGQLGPIRMLVNNARISGRSGTLGGRR